MKRVKFIIMFILAFMLMTSVCADSLNPLVYQYTNPEVTVVFSEPLGVAPERQQSIADEIAGVDTSLLSSPGSVSPDNIICTLFGHKLSDQVTVTATHHKVNQYQPRCLMEVYHVTYCTRCDYTDSQLVDSIYIFCCPED